MSKEIVRVMRILIYEGDRDFVERSLKGANVPINGVYTVPGTHDQNKIKSRIIDDFPEILKEIEDE